MKVWIIKVNDTKDKKEYINKFLSDIYRQENDQEIDFNKFFYGKYGKPYYDGDFYFNVSHSKNYLAIAIAASEVGIDIEEERKLTLGVEKRILTKDEINSTKEKLIKTWTAKEAYAKYKGQGLSLPFDQVAIDDIKKEVKLYDLSSKAYYCYAVGTEKLDDIKIIEIKNQN